MRNLGAELAGALTNTVALVRENGSVEDGACSITVGSPVVILLSSRDASGAVSRVVGREHVLKDSLGLAGEHGTVVHVGQLRVEEGFDPNPDCSSGRLMFPPVEHQKLTLQLGEEVPYNL